MRSLLQIFGGLLGIAELAKLYQANRHCTNRQRINHRPLLACPSFCGTFSRSGIVWLGMVFCVPHSCKHNAVLAFVTSRKMINQPCQAFSLLTALRSTMVGCCFFEKPAVTAELVQCISAGFQVEQKERLPASPQHISTCKAAMPSLGSDAFEVTVPACTEHRESRGAARVLATQSLLVPGLTRSDLRNCLHM